jgi:CRP-like cAMP-binding protein
MKESGLIDNMLQDLFQYRTQLRRLGLEIIADRLKAANDRVRQLLTERNDERSAQIMGELKAAREATDRAYLTLVRLTNAYALLNPDVESAQKLVALVSEDLEYFRKHAMAPSHRDKKTPEPDAEPATQDETPAEA